VHLLLGDENGRLRHSNGVPIAREIVNFVSFNDVHGNASQCASECLNGIPEQIVQHFTNAGIQPLPPVPVPDYNREMDKLHKANQRKKHPR
jgi:hypothetical protein